MAASAYPDQVDVFNKDKDGDTELHLAIILGKPNLAISLISITSDYRCLSSANNLFQTPLHLAALTNQPEVVRRLVCAGADVTSRDLEGNTPLHIACRDGKLEVVKSLIEPLPQSGATQFQKITQVFSISNYVGLTCLHLAASKRHLDIMGQLIKYNIDVNMAERKSGRTVLHSACETGDIELVKFLLGNGSCDTDARASDGKTPYEIARACGYEDVCLALAAAGSGGSISYYDRN